MRGGWPLLVLSASASASACGRVAFDPLEAAPVDSLPDQAAMACPGTAGPSMIEVTVSNARYCIDSTEVTRADYETFLGVGAGIQPSECSGNTEFAPDSSVWPPNANERMLPVVGIDWCDARAFCAYAGKRLCGAIGGGGLTSVAMATGATSQWYQVCTFAGSRSYPYGMSYVSGQCSDGAVVIDVHSKPGCESGFPGVFDLSGNAHEWIDACDAGGDCVVIGGGVGGHSPSDMDCNSPNVMPRLSKGNDSGQSWIRETGFRCCS